MEEGAWYELQNFDIVYATDMTRVTTNQYQINLSNSSLIFKIPPLSFSNYYHFHTFEIVLHGLSHPKFSIDLYGALVSVGEIEAFGIQNHRIQFNLVNIDYVHITCVAYGEVAKFLDHFWNSTNAPVVLCVLQFWKIVWGVGGLQNVTTIDGFSKIHIEPDDFPEIQSFRMRIPYYNY